MLAGRRKCREIVCHIVTVGEGRLSCRASHWGGTIFCASRWGGTTVASRAHIHAHLWQFDSTEFNHAVDCSKALGFGLDVFVALLAMPPRVKLGQFAKRVAKKVMREQRRRQRWILWILETDFSVETAIEPPSK